MISEHISNKTHKGKIMTVFIDDLITKVLLLSPILHCMYRYKNTYSNNILLLENSSTSSTCVYRTSKIHHIFKLNNIAVDKNHYKIVYYST